MHPDDIKDIWQNQTTHTPLAVDAGLVLKEIQHSERQFATTIFWRDVREVGTSLVLIPVWLVLGVKNSLPWTWYLAIPALLWIAGFMLVDRRRHRPKPAEHSEPLRACVERSLAEVEHQIRLLRNVFWWYLLPLALPMFAFFAQVSWKEPLGGWLSAVAFVVLCGIVSGVFALVYWLNLTAIRTQLEPRREELEKLLGSLKEETEH
jgi:hypothetical protein